MYDLEQLKTTFSTLMEHSYKEVPGVLSFDSGVEGPVLCVIACTHGNEPAGLAVAKYLMDSRIQERLIKGKILLVLGNIAATRAYFLTTDEEAKKETRFVDVNMNRLPKTLEGNEHLSEVDRLLALIPILEEGTVGLDVHSTTLPSDPMIISLASTSKELLRMLPIETILGNADGVIGEDFLIHYVGGRTNDRVQRVAIEAGSHEDAQSFVNAVRTVDEVLAGYGMVDEEMENLELHHQLYMMKESIFFPDDSYELAREFPTFCTVTKGEIIARGNGPDIVASQDGHAVFAPKGLKATSLDEAVLFITDPVQTIV